MLLLWYWIKSCCQAAQVHHDQVFVHRWRFHWWPCALVQGVVQGLQCPFLAKPAFKVTTSTPLPDQIAIIILGVAMVVFVSHTFSMAAANALQTGCFFFLSGAAEVHGREPSATTATKWVTKKAVYAPLEPNKPSNSLQPGAGLPESCQQLSLDVT